MGRYIITEKAGRRVAGRRNTGVGTALELSEAEAAAALAAGELVGLASDAPAAPGKPAQDGAKGRGGGRGSPEGKKAPAAKKRGV